MDHQERNPREVATHKVDLLKPIPTLPETEDCFGKSFDAYCMDCRQCADNDLCLIQFGKKNKVKVKEVEATQEVPFLDLADFAGVNKAKMAKIIDKAIDAGTPLATENLIEYIGLKANVADKQAIATFFKEFGKDYGFRAAHGEVIRR